MVLSPARMSKVCGRNVCVPKASMHLSEYVRDNIRHFDATIDKYERRATISCYGDPHHHHGRRMSSGGQPKVHIFSWPLWQVNTIILFVYKLPDNEWFLIGEIQIRQFDQVASLLFEPFLLMLLFFFRLLPWRRATLPVSRYRAIVRDTKDLFTFLHCRALMIVTCGFPAKYEVTLLSRLNSITNNFFSKQFLPKCFCKLVNNRCRTSGLEMAAVFFHLTLYVSESFYFSLSFRLLC